MTLRVRIQARAKSTAIDGLHAGRLKIRLKAPPVDGKANRALSNLLAEQFGVRTTEVEIVRGTANRDKTVSIVSPHRLPGWFESLGGTAPA